MISKVLILDDKLDQVQELLETLNSSDQYYVKATSDYMNENLYNSMDLLIIDWDLTGTDSNGAISTSIIKDLLSTRVVPIIIYTSHLEESVSQVVDSAFSEIQRELIKIIQKGDLATAIDEVKTTLENSDNLVVRISYLWKVQLNTAIEKSILTINKRLNNKALSLLMKECELDTQHLPTEITNLLTDLLSSEIVPLDTEINPINDHEQGEGYEAYKWLVQLRKYALPTDKRHIFTGDIFKINDDEYGIVITPKCDLARPSEISKVKFLIGRDFYKSKYKGNETLEQWKSKTENIMRNYFISPSEKEYWVLDIPVNGEEISLVFRFDEVYTETVETFMNNTYPRIINLRSPYLEDIIQSYSTFQLRIGLPSRPFNKGDKTDREKFVKAMADDMSRKYVAATNQEVNAR
ncbi:response regulator receiver domain [Paenibacillus chitinolyticus]|uniref:response regulator receiver domain n=1 Tax=Paenibacillus chitinolyticus TaxID=79263 RepID=UPI002DBD4977|nr:response regulator receiver domain [Paenibacillus chitinolyticus]MEC0247261.1 response regulator receiver domain [Paenibacillus chitinolyticus]